MAVQLNNNILVPTNYPSYNPTNLLPKSNIFPTILTNELLSPTKKHVPLSSSSISLPKQLKRNNHRTHNNKKRINIIEDHLSNPNLNFELNVFNNINTNIINQNDQTNQKLDFFKFGTINIQRGLERKLTHI